MLEAHSSTKPMAQDAQSPIQKAKMERLAWLREEARKVEQELEEGQRIRTASGHGTPRSALSGASTPRVRSSRIPRTAKFDSVSRSLPDGLKFGESQSKQIPEGVRKVVDQYRETISSNYHSIQLQFNAGDRDKSGRVGTASLTELLQKCSIAIPIAQVQAVCAILSKDDMGRVGLSDFLNLFINPPSNTPQHTRSEGLNMSRLSSRQETRRPFTAAGRSAPAPATSAATKQAGFMMHTSKDSVEQRLAFAGSLQGTTITLMSEVNDYVKYYRKKYDELFNAADFEGNNMIPKGQVLRIFRSTGLPLVMEQLDEIMNIVGEKPDNGLINYRSLLTKLQALTFDMPELFEYLTSVRFAPTHLVDIIGRSVKKRYSQALRVVNEEDSDGNGEMSKTALLRVVKGAGLEISETQLEEGLEQMGLNQHGSVNCHKFLQYFVPEHHIPSKEEYAQRSIASRIPKEIASAPAMDVPLLLKTLQDKMTMYIKHPREMFLKLDEDKDGAITKQELEKAFKYFNLYPSKKECEELFTVLDVQQRGKIDYVTFLQKLAPRKAAVQNMMGHDVQREYLPKGTIGPLPKMQKANNLSPADLATVMKKQVQMNTRKLEIMLREKDIYADGFLDRDSLLQVLRRVDLYITYSQMQDALLQIGIPLSDRIGIDDFLNHALKPISSGKDTISPSGATRRGLTMTRGSTSGSSTHRERLEDTQTEEGRILTEIAFLVSKKWDTVRLMFSKEEERVSDPKLKKDQLAHILKLLGMAARKAEVGAEMLCKKANMDFSNFRKVLSEYGAVKRLPSSASGPSGGLKGLLSKEGGSRPGTSRV